MSLEVNVSRPPAWYVIENGLKKAKHCRFHFNHFVSKAVKPIQDTLGRIRDYVFARAGKDLVLPRRPGDPVPEAMPRVPETGELIPLRPTTGLGPTASRAVGSSDDKLEPSHFASVQW